MTTLDTAPASPSAAPARVDERDIRRRQGEEPEQLLPADLREPSQPLQLLIREHLSRQRDPSPQRGQDPQLRRLLSHIRPILGEYYGDPVTGRVMTHCVPNERVAQTA